MRISCRQAISVLVTLPLLVACDDKQTASPDNFARGLQSYYDGHPECVALPIDLPIDTPVGTADPRRQRPDAMVAAGLLSATPVNASAAVQYSLTAAGEAAIRKGADPFLGGMTLCYARRKVVKVTSFTPPADVLGVKASRVTFDYELRDIAPWAKNESLQDAFPEIKSGLAAPNRTDTEGIVLTSGGWVDEHMVR